MYIKLVYSFNLNFYALFCPWFKAKQELEICSLAQFFIKIFCKYICYSKY